MSWRTKNWNEYTFQDLEQASLDVFGTEVGVTKMSWDSVCNSPDGAVIEVGSQNGYSSLSFIMACRKMGKQFISIDPYPSEWEGIAFAYIEGMGAASKLAYETDILSNFPETIQYNKDITEIASLLPESISVAFIDGFHDEVWVQREFDILSPRLVVGGYMMLDDTGWVDNQSGVGSGGPAAVWTKICSNPQYSVESQGWGNICRGLARKVY